MAVTLPLSTEQRFRFIELVREHPCIWDTTLLQYHDRNLARESYISIAREMANGMAEVDVPKIMKSLRTQYTQKLNNWRASVGKDGNSADGTGSTAYPSWRYFQKLDFLRPHVQTRKPRDNSTNHSNESGYEDDGQSLQPPFVIKRSQSAPSSAGSSCDDVDFAAKDSSLEDEDFMQSSEAELDSLAQTANPSQPQSSSTSSQAAESRVRPKACGRPVGSKKRKMDPAEEAVSLLHHIVQRTKPAQSKKPTEIQAFFTMLEKTVEKLPEEAQDRLCLEFYRMALEEKANVRDNQDNQDD